MIHDPMVSGTLYAGLAARLADDGQRRRPDLEDNCPEFTTAGDQPGCGDFGASAIRPARAARARPAT